MGRPLLQNAGNIDKGFGSTTVAIALFLSVSALVALCAKHSRRDARRSCNTTRSPLASPRRGKNSKKAIHNEEYKETDDGFVSSEIEMERSGELGEDGLWQKSIMMGDKCRPPEFSGVIYYDSHGNQLPEMPRSPRASPLRSFSFPVLN